MKVIKLYLGLDVHKDSITIAIADPERNGEIRIAAAHWLGGCELTKTRR